MTIFVQVLFKDGSHDKSTTVYESATEAEIAYHTALASAMNKQGYIRIIAMLVNENGEVIMRRVWTR